MLLIIFLHIFGIVFFSFLSNHSLKNPTQNIHQIAICVELTGNPIWDAIITVNEAEIAIVNALILSSSVISLHTVFIILGQYKESHTEIHKPHIARIHKGIFTSHETVQFITASYIAAIGQIALATSLAQWANVKSHTAKIKGIVKRRFTDSLLFFIF